jgi:hypothetical protein
MVGVGTLVSMLCLPDVIEGAQTGGTDSLAVSLSFDTTRFLPGDQPIEFTLNRPLIAEEGELVLLIGGVDFSALAERTPQRVRFLPVLGGLPAGRSDVRIFRSVRGRWTELRRLTIQVLNAGGFRSATLTPSATMSSKGQVASGQVGLPEPERATYQDLTLSSSLSATGDHPAFRVETSANMLGASRREEALRFSLRPANAPRYDLADYRFTIKAGDASLTMGHTGYGASRHLISGFSSRGLSAAWSRGGTQLSAATLNATSIVGWDHLIGMNNGNHRVFAAGLGREIVVSRPGLMRIDATVMDASRLPHTGFTQGAVVDAETSTGGSVQVSAASAGQRLRLTSGVSKSTFDVPARDGQLAGDSTLVPLLRKSRSARFLEAGVVPVQGVTIPGLGQAILSIGVRHERVDPLYRSVTAPAQADRQQEGIDANANAGPVSIQMAVGRARDNLESVPTLMTTRDKTRSSAVAVQLGQLLRVVRLASWFPTLSLSTNRTEQVADGVPAGGGFQPSELPNQVSTIRDAAAQWQAGSWRFSVRSNLAQQDNRQTGRDLSDFESGSDAVSAGWSFGPSGDVSVDLAEDHLLAKERNERSETRRVTVNLNLRRGQSTSLSMALSLLRTQPPTGGVTTNGSQHVELTQPLTFLRDRNGGARGQLFVRFGRTSARLPDFAAQIPNVFLQQRQWTVSSGLNVRMF